MQTAAGPLRGHGGPAWPRACGDYLAGRLDDVGRVARAGLREGSDGDAALAALLARVLLHHDRAPEATRVVEARVSGDGPHRPDEFGADWLLWVRALLAEHDDPDRAAGLARDAWLLLPGLHDLYGPWLVAGDVVRLTAARHPDVAGAVTAEVDTLAALLGSNAPGVQALALRCRGLVSRDADLLRGASDLAARSPRPMLAAATLEDLAGVLEAGPERRRVLTRAAAVYRRHGAVRDAARAREQAGDAPPARDVRRERPSSGWAALTDAEVRVVDLVATGLTNREAGARLFVSSRTVETHLAHACQKLGVSRRTELAARVAGRGRIDG